jgi:hypothetical protein
MIKYSYMNNLIFKKKFLQVIIFILLLFFFFSLTTPHSETKVIAHPFGGRIIGYIPTCNGGTSTLIFLQIPPAVLPPTVLYVWGASQSFLMGPPTHPGQ